MCSHSGFVLEGCALQALAVLNRLCRDESGATDPRATDALPAYRGVAPLCSPLTGSFAMPQATGRGNPRRRAPFSEWLYRFVHNYPNTNALRIVRWAWENASAIASLPARSRSPLYLKVIWVKHVGWP